MQLTIRDGLKGRGASNIFMPARDVVKQLRNLIIMANMKKKGRLLPIIDSETRWGSSFAMLNRLLTLKDLVVDYAAASPDLRLSDSAWENTEAL